MEEAELQKRRRMVTKSSSLSIKRKPLSDLTNIARKPLHPSSSKKPLSSSHSNSSIGSTQNPIRIHPPVSDQPQRLAPDCPAGNENHIGYTQRQNTQNTRSKTKAAPPFLRTSFLETGNNGKEGSVSLGSSTLEKIKDQGYVNQSCLDKIKNDENKVSAAPHFSSLEKTKDKRKATDVPLSVHNVKYVKTSMNTPTPHYATKIKDKGKENDGQFSYSFAGNANNNTDNAMPDSLMKRKDKGKAVAMDYLTMKNVMSNMVGVRVPLKGVMIKDREETLTGSSHVDIVLNNKGKENDGQFSYPFTGNANINMDISMPDSVMKRKDKGNAIAMDFPTMKNVMSNMVGVRRIPLKGIVIKDREETSRGSSRIDLAQKDKGKKMDGQSSYPFAGNANINMDVTMPDSLIKSKDKGKTIAMDYPTTKNVKSNMVGVRIPLKGMISKDREETVAGSSRTDLVQKDKGKAVVTPISYRALEKKDKQSSCPPLLRTMSNRNEADGAEDMIPSKLQTEPPRNKKKRRSSSKEVVENFALPQDYVEQQRAYFKEIDDFELQVEEV